ncbi:MAG TPA: hypothetical protein VFA41_20910 [Ktedonobacteraceae bacterium]|jgi:hypothetical protein|nr:hypothetical protein [Ktedonobacteraceae bacterium]
MTRLKGIFRYPARSFALTVTLFALFLGLPWLRTAHAASSSCQLNSPAGNVQHVIYIQFDNTHFMRDNPNVPSDLEQMPNLLNFIENNGVMLTNHHTPLIAHTATDILTSLTGVYGDRHGVPVSNSFRYFKPDGTTSLGVSFAYWTDPIYDPTTSTPTDTTYNMLAANGKNAPAPWVPYTRAGCNVGAVATANTILENIGTDIPTVFGPNSPEAQEVKNNPNQATADFVGIGIHCALNDPVCANSSNAKPDILPDEPGGYNGYQALYGNKYVAPQISPNGPMTDLFGNVIKDSHGDIGFPGFDGMSAAVSLSYVTAMQEHGVPVTYAYISDAHDAHPNGPAYGPGQAGYVAALKSYDQAFGIFFQRLANDGITPANTLFVFTADEGDHFVGGSPSPSNCDGVNVPCTYSQIGEINANMTGLLATEQGITTPFTVHSDAAPTVYITGNPARNDENVTRPFERATGKLTAVNPITGQTDNITNYMADPVEMSLLHMITADPARTPTFTLFANPNYFLFAGAPNCSSPCVTENPAFAWNHGDVAPDINTTWLGMVGPGVQHLGVDGNVWSDHTDIRPTMMELLGLKDDYSHDGRVLFEILTPSALPPVIRQNLNAFITLAQAYKQINAPVGALGLTTLQVSTIALESNAPNDSTYTNLENQLLNITSVRNSVASQMIAILESAEFGGGNSQNAGTAQINNLVSQANGLIQRAKGLKSGH